MAEENGANKRILVVEDEQNARAGYETLLRKWGYTVLGVASGEEALERFEEFQPQLILSDVNLPGIDGIELLRRLAEDQHDIPSIVITGDPSDDRTVKAIEAGAYWFIIKPHSNPVLRALIGRAFRQIVSDRQVVSLRRELRDTGRLGSLIGESKPMREVLHLIELAAPSSASVLITGETGSGKEIVARTLHELSPRSEAAFVAVNCSAIPESLMESEIFGHEKGAFTGASDRRLGCFELADRGTLLLDEIGEMPAPTQAKLLRVLEDGKVRRLGSKAETPVNVRVLAATNREPEEAVNKGVLRQDLFFRLNVFRIHLPPLREHKEDLPKLVEQLLADLGAKHGKNIRGVGPEVMEAFQSYTWPGNVRELRNVLERALIVCEKEVIGRAHLPPGFGHAPANVASGLSSLRFPMGTTVAAAERELILQTLTATNNKTRAAEILGISLKTLHNKLKEYEAEQHRR